jgi:hypothetical protein
MGTSRGGTPSWTVTPEVAAPGDRVTVELHDNSYGSDRGHELFLTREDEFADGPRCSDLPDAVKGAEIVWTHNDIEHDGVAQFTAPEIPDGRYALGEERPSRVLRVSVGGLSRFPPAGRQTRPCRFHRVRGLHF